MAAASMTPPPSPRAASTTELDNIDYSHENPPMLGAIWPLTVLAALFIWLRVYCKFRRGRGLWWDDHLLLASWACLFLNVALHTRRVALGFGQFVDSIPLGHRYELGMLNNVAVTFGIFGVAWSKTSFALSLLRIATQSWYRRLIIAIIATMNCFLGSGAVLIWLQPRQCWLAGSVDACVPVKAAVGANIAANAYSALMDVVLACIPWVILRNVQIKRKEKIGIAVAMSMGLLGAIAAIVKCYGISKVNRANVSGYGAPPLLIIWGVVEMTVTIIAASIPVLRVLIIEIRGSSADRSRSRALAAANALANSSPVSANASKSQHRVAVESWDMNNAADPMYELDVHSSPHAKEHSSSSVDDLEMDMIDSNPRYGSTDQFKNEGEAFDVQHLHMAPIDSPHVKKR